MSNSNPPTPINSPATIDIDEIRKKLAAIEHERWADWQNWCHKILRENCPSQELEMVLQRWDRQINTPYSELTLAEKDSDLEQVDRYWPLITDLITEKENRARVDPYDFVEPCEPECSPERHAYHQGQWDMAGRINKHFGLDPYPGATLKSKGKME